jgi:hypothetical protein
MSDEKSEETVLYWYEISVAIHVANLRHSLSLKARRRDRSGMEYIDIDRDLHSHLYGVLGEIAYAKINNVYYDASVDTFSRGDVGNVQIKTIGGGKNTKLIIKSTNKLNYFFVLIEIKKRDRESYSAIYHGGINGEVAGEHEKWKNYKKDIVVPREALSK